MSYDPTNWRTGDLITAVKMNNIEEGIVNVEETTTDRIDDQDDVIAELGQTVDTRLDDQDDAITAISDSVGDRIDTQDDAIVTMSAQLGDRVTAQDAAIRALSYSVENRLDDQEDEIAIVRQQVASPFVIVATASQMTDHDKAYVYVGSESGYVTGNWYYWGGSSWVSGGSAADPTLSISGAPADAKVTGDMFDTCARTDGSYDSMTVGNAEQLVSTVSTEDSVPYAFRTSGGAADIGDREQDIVVGGTVNWNQLVANANKSGSYTWNADSTEYSHIITNISPILVTKSHKYYVSLKIMRTISSNNGISLQLRGSDGQVFQGLILNNGDADGYVVAVMESSANKDTNITRVTANNYNYKRGFNAGDTVSYDDLILIDLTAMFGTAIADYIYSIEQATAGAGVALAKRWGNIIKSYYPYQANGLVSVEGLQRHDMTGFNQWDEEWELGGYNQSTGEKVAYTTSIRAKNYIPVLPNTTYYIKGPNTIRLFFYDDEYGFLENFVRTNDTFTTPVRCGYMTFHVSNTTTYQNDICINLSWDGSRDGEYEPYEKHSYTLDSLLTLRGIPKLNENNELYYDGDRYFPDGTVERRYGIVDLGTLTWNRALISGSNVYRFGTISLNKIIKLSGNYKILSCSKYPSVAFSDMPSVDKTISKTGGYNTVAIRDDSYNNAADFKTAMSGVYLVYELETPTTESAMPYSENQYVDDWGTEEYVTSSESDYIPCVGHETKYLTNLKAKLEDLPSASSSGDGEYLINQMNGKMSLIPASSIIPTQTTVGAIALSASWTGTASPYTQVVTVTGATITANSKVDLQPTAVQLASLMTDNVTALVVENNNTTLTVYALGAAPSSAMTVQCTITEVQS